MKETKQISPLPDHNAHGPLVAGIIIILIGLYFLLERYDLLPPVGDSWPVHVIIVGIAIIIGYLVNLRSYKK